MTTEIKGKLIKVSDMTTKKGKKLTMLLKNGDKAFVAIFNENIDDINIANCLVNELCKLKYKDTNRYKNLIKGSLKQLSYEESEKYIEEAKRYDTDTSKGKPDVKPDNNNSYERDIAFGNAMNCASRIISAKISTEHPASRFEGIWKERKESFWKLAEEIYREGQKRKNNL